MRKILITAIISIIVTVSISAQDSNWSLEGDFGYALPFGQGLRYGTPGAYDPSYTYRSEKNTLLDNSGWVFDAKGSYGLAPDLSLLLGASYLFGDTSFSGTAYPTFPGVAHTRNDKSTWSSYRFSAGLRYTFLRVSSWSFFGGTGPLLVVPNDLKTDVSWDYTSITAKDTISFNPGLGAYGELGTEYKINDSFGVNLTLAFDKVSVALLKEVFSRSDGYTSTTSYSDNPSVDQNDQTASDVAKSSANNFYYTNPSDSVDLSDLGLKIGIVGHF